MLVTSCKYLLSSSFFRMTVTVDLGVQKDSGRLIQKKVGRYSYVLLYNKCKDISKFCCTDLGYDCQYSSKWTNNSWLFYFDETVNILIRLTN